MLLRRERRARERVEENWVSCIVGEVWEVDVLEDLRIVLFVFLSESGRFAGEARGNRLKTISCEKQRFCFDRTTPKADNDSIESEVLMIQSRTEYMDEEGKIEGD